MTTCTNLIGNWIPHRCGGEIVNGRCRRCGAAGNQGTADNDSGSLEIELPFSNEELEKFGVILSSEHGNANPPEWGNDPFTDFT